MRSIVHLTKNYTYIYRLQIYGSLNIITDRRIKI